MKALPLTPEFTTMARRVIWFEEPEQALADPVRFVTYAMTYGLPGDMKTLREYYSDDELREALDHAPPGIFDAFLGLLEPQARAHLGPATPGTPVHLSRHRRRDYLEHPDASPRSVAFRRGSPHPDQVNISHFSCDVFRSVSPRTLV